jgi:hypothetical protein
VTPFNAEWHPSMAPPPMSQTSTLTPAAHGLAIRTPIRLIQAAAGLLILILLAFHLTILIHSRKSAIAG